MRLLFGIILGVALTVGVAFVSDTWATGPSSNVSTTNGSASATAEHRNMVNWDVVSDNMRIVRERARETWTKLSQKVSS
jgi:hypothetical protein